MIAQKSDILILDSRGRPGLIVEVDNQKDLTIEKAREFQRDTLPSLGLPAVPFFLLASQDKGYLWASESGKAYEIDPTHSFSMAEIVSHYRGRNGDHTAADSERLRESSLRLLLWRWFVDLVYQKSVIAAGVPLPAEFEVVAATIHGGEVHTEQAP